MIMPMKKITLVVLDREREEALASLRKTGVLHVEKREVTGQSVTDLHALILKLDQAAAILFDKKADKKAPSSRRLERKETFELVDRVFALRDEYRSVFENKTYFSNELDRLKNWGNINPDDFAFLAERNVFVFPFEMTIAEYQGLPDTIRTIKVNQDKKTVRCLLWSSTNNVPDGIPLGAIALTLPSQSSSEIKSGLEIALKRMIAIDEMLVADSNDIDSIQSQKEELLKELEFEVIKTGMPLISLGKDDASISRTSLAWLTGFVPASEESTLRLAAEQHGWAYISDEPLEEDNVPTQIKNNRFVNLISPLLDFLGTVPGYRELDISLWFLLFFGIFFAMIFGDAGYGALLVLISFGGIFTSLAKRKVVATGLYMFLYLGLMTMVWGTVTATWFGIPVNSLPQVLRSIALPIFSNENPDAPTNIKVFCFSLGLIQISLAHIIGMIRNIKSLKVLGELGALVLTVGMFYVVLNLVVDGTKYPLDSQLGQIMLAMVGGGFFLNFLFINYSGSVGGGIVESLKNVITMFLGVVNMFGDIMSYIRLWAVGLAGSAISATINTMAGPMLGGFIIFAGVLLLFFGHGLNLVMNVLSVIVHGVRLNTLEFSNHLGLTWSGFKYEPFSETVNK